MDNKDNNDSKEFKSTNKKYKYKSSKFILEYMHKEYEKENERRKNIESRIPILITIATFFGALILDNNVDINKLLQNKDKKVYIFSLLQGLSYITLIIALGIFISVLISRKYKSIKLDNFNKIKPQGEDEGLIAYELIKSYKECYDYNKKVNDFKFKINNVGIILLSVSIILYLIEKIIYIFGS